MESRETRERESKSVEINGATFFIYTENVELKVGSNGIVVKYTPTKLESEQEIKDFACECNDVLIKEITSFINKISNNSFDIESEQLNYGSSINFDTTLSEFRVTYDFNLKLR